MKGSNEYAISYKQLKHILENKLSISSSDLSTLINQLDQKPKFNDFFSGKRAIKKLLISRFDEIILLVKPQDRKTIINIEGIKDKEIESKILGLALDLLKNELDENNRVKTNERFMGRIFKLAYDDKLSKTHNKETTELRDYLENNISAYIKKESVFIEDSFSYLEHVGELSHFLELLNKNFDVFLDSIENFGEYDISSRLAHDEKKFCILLTGNFSRFCARMEKRGILDYVLKDQIHRNEYIDFRKCFIEFPKFKEEVIQEVINRTNKDGLKNNKNFLWMSNMLSQCDSLDLVADTMQDFFDSEEEIFDVDRIYNYIEIIGNIKDSTKAMKLLKENSSKLLKISTTPLRTLKTIKELNEKLLNNNPNFSEEEKLDIEELNTIVDDKTLEIAWEIAFNSRSPYSLKKTIEGSNFSKEKIKEQYPNITDDEMIDRDVITSVFGKKMAETARTLMKNHNEVEVLRRIIEELVKNEEVRPSDIEVLGSGGYSVVYGVGEKVLKIGRVPQTYDIPRNHRRLIQPLVRRTDILEDRYVEITERCEPQSKVKFDDLYKVYKELRDDGLVWTDAKTANLGKLKRPNKIYFSGIGMIMEDGSREWGSDSYAHSGQGLGQDEKQEHMDEPLGEGEYVVIDLDFVFSEEDPNINWPKNSISRRLEEKYQEEKSGKDQEMDEK
ncbi:MAG: hypothetical protein IKR04_06940 [Clostridia bacterium]|nr:hypothetical protein [Clostridia bacterium]